MTPAHRGPARVRTSDTVRVIQDLPIFKGRRMCQESVGNSVSNLYQFHLLRLESTLFASCLWRCLAAGNTKESVVVETSTSPGTV